MLDQAWQRNRVTLKLRGSSSLRDRLRHTLRADAHLILRVVFQETLDTTTWELVKRHGESVIVSKMCMY